MKKATFKSDFALLDVTKGRNALVKRLGKLKGESIPVVIHAEIINQWGNDDGTSIEFELQVRNVYEADQ